MKSSEKVAMVIAQLNPYTWYWDGVIEIEDLPMPEFEITETENSFVLTRK